MKFEITARVDGKFNVWRWHGTYNRWVPVYVGTEDEAKEFVEKRSK